MDINDSPVLPETPAGQETTPAETSAVGQGQEEAQSSNQAPTYEERLSEFYAKKGWDIEKTPSQLLDSYVQLESKLGNWSEVEQKAKRLDEITTKLPELEDKAKRWEEAQNNFKRLQEQKLIDEGKLDLNQARTDILAQLWREGRISLADIPKNRQYEVQNFVSNQDQQFSSTIKAQADDLVSKHPILKEPEIMELVATQIERGWFDQRLGRELTPDEIVARVEQKFQAAEKKGEERLKQTQAEIVNGNLERSGSSVQTKPNVKVRTVAEALKFAKEQHGG